MKNKVLTFRLSESERDMIQARANAKGLTTSSLIRTMTVNKIKSDKELDNLLFNKTKNFDRQN